MKAILLSLALLAGAAVAQTTGTQTTGTTTQTPAAPAVQPAPATPTPATPTPPSTEPAATQDPATVVARVGGDTVTLGDFEKEYNIYVARLINAQGLPYSEDARPYFNQYRPEILNEIARQRGLVQLAVGAGIQPDDAKVDELLASNKQGFENDDAFTAALQQSGYADETQLRAAIAEGLQASAYLDSLKGKFNFPDAVVSSYYQTHKAEFTQESQACVKHILVPDEAAAKAARARLDAGEDFAKVAGDVSTDPGSKDKGGDLGCFGPGVTVPEFDKAAFTGPLNQIQQVKTQFGVHLLDVTGRTEAGLQPLADVQAAIRDKLAQQAAQKYVASKLAGLKLQTFPNLVALPTPEQPAPGQTQPGQPEPTPPSP